MTFCFGSVFVCVLEGTFFWGVWGGNGFVVF